VTLRTAKATDEQEAMQILIVEDNDVVADGLSRALAMLDSRLCVYRAADLRTAQELLQNGPRIDVALVDLGLPDAQGIEAPTKLKIVSPDLVIVVITGDSSSDTALSLIRLGIQDYIPKSEATPNRIFRTISLARERYEREQRLKRIACVDQLTGSLNRRGLLSAIRESHDVAVRLNIPSALMTIDIDHFKEINDTYGHPIGDLILRQGCRRIAHCIRENDVVGRAGGDEFWVVLNGFTSPENIPAIAKKMLKSFSAPFRVNSEVMASISIGVALMPDHAGTIREWMQKSDIAMYEAKRKGRNRWAMYDDGIKAEQGAEPIHPPGRVKLQSV
jgi:diguanylate cyclase (GGDEF)-like protein